MIPQIQSVSDEIGINIQEYPSRTYYDREKNIVGKTDGKNAIIQTTRHILYKERYAYPIYPNWFGMELEKYKGQPFGYLQAQIEKDLKSALLQDSRIYDIIVTNIQQIDIDSALVQFDEYTNEGVITNQEVTVSV